MGKLISEWIKDALYPSLFEHIDRALPEHNFKRFSGGWRSKTYLNGTAHKDRLDKTVVTKKAPGLILENGGDVLSLVDYVMQRDGATFIQAVETLAGVAGLSLPRGELDQASYQKYKDQTTLLETCNNYFIYCLEHATDASKVKDYLASRGYSKEDIEAMELGCIPDQEKLSQHLLKKNYSQSLIDETLKLNKGIGSTHQLTIPYRSGGTIKGFKFRAIEEKIAPKYLNSTGLDKIGGFFNLSGIKGDKDIVIVEGELDSLSAIAKGMENVVATGGSSVAPEQIRDAVNKGAKSFTLCFDKEPDKEEITTKKVNSAIQVILSEGVNRVYIVNLPDLGKGKTDPDRLIKENGAEAFKKAIDCALPYYSFKLQKTIDKFGKIENERGLLEPKDIDDFLEEVVQTAAQITNTIDRDRYQKQFTSLEAIKNLGISEESLSLTVERLTSIKNKKEQAKELKRLLAEATQLQSKGETHKALELLNSKAKELKLQDKAAEFSNLLKPVKESELKERQASKPESLDSGYLIAGEALHLPSGAISIIAAPTSHGKTTFLLNLALNVAKKYPDKEVHLFSYEEDGDSVLISALNTYLDNEISQNNRRSIRSYFATSSAEYIKPEQQRYFEEKKNAFFKELIETQRLNVHYSNYDSDTLIEAIRYLCKHANPGAVFIDYIQLLNLPKGKYTTYSRQEEIKAICIALKDVAVETGLPIVLGAQFNREVVNPVRIHPTKLGEAGDIERIANLIVGFWNGNFKHLSTEAETAEIENKGITSDTLYVTVLKNRGGKVGQEETLLFDGNTGTIKNKTYTNYFNK